MVRQGVTRCGVLLLLLDGSYAWHATSVRPTALVPSCSQRAATSVPMMAINPSDFQEFAVYDLEMEEKMSALEAEIVSLREAKAVVEAQLETKAQEVAKFVESVEGELNEARQSVKTLTSEVTMVKAELAEQLQEPGLVATQIPADKTWGIVYVWWQHAAACGAVGQAPRTAVSACSVARVMKAMILPACSHPKPCRHKPWGIVYVCW